MPSLLPTHPDIKRQLRARLLGMTPRAFELFAGELLVYVGLQNVVVTRYVGDGGIDAHGDVIIGSGVIRIPAGVQVKRHRQNVQRSDIERFIGALSGRFSEGIFITTAGYADQAINKASGSIPRVSTISGDQVVSVMLRHSLGIETINSPDSMLDESYFEDFEQQTTLVQSQISERRESYQAGEQTTTNESPRSETTIEIRPEDDLISLRALSYALRVDTTTIRSWIDSGKLQPDRYLQLRSQEGYYFRRDRVEAIRQQLSQSAPPETGAEWHQEFLDFAKSRHLTKSYKPVLLKTLIKLVNRNGEVNIDDLVREFKAFYIQRQIGGLPVEYNAPALADPLSVSDNKVKQLIVKYPLDRFLIRGFLEYLPDQEVVRFAPRLWSELRFYELLDVITQADEQLHYYYERHT